VVLETYAGFEEMDLTFSNKWFTVKIHISFIKSKNIGRRGRWFIFQLNEKDAIL
jgi:hypothetical protein